MIKKIFIAIAAAALGFAFGYYVIFYTPIFSLSNSSHYTSPVGTDFKKTEIIGFMPYWLLSNAKTNYKESLTDIIFFALTIDEDGTILKMNNPNENEPGWFALKSGKFDKMINIAKNDRFGLSLSIFSSNNKTIDKIISQPKLHAANLVNDVVPLMKKYGFTSLNLDLESTKDASESDRINFSLFVNAIKQGLNRENINSLSLDISVLDFFRKRIVDPFLIGNIVDKVIIMAYDYHYIGSKVIGPVSPLGGAGEFLEFDIKTVVEKALEIVPSSKIILGLPLYGYEWETIDNNASAAVIPGTGRMASTFRIQELLASCSSCSVSYRDKSEEALVVFKDQLSDSYHQIFYPDVRSLSTKIKFADEKKLGGIAFWALGYEGDDILKSAVDYKNNNDFLFP
jgi:spore germination protein YaaH